MEQTRRPVDRSSVGTVVAALLVGFLVLLLLFPASGVDTQPPVCYSMLLYPVPCEGWVAPLGGAVAAGLLGIVLWRIGHGRQ